MRKMKTAFVVLCVVFLAIAVEAGHHRDHERNHGDEYEHGENHGNGHGDEYEHGENHGNGNGNGHGDEYEHGEHGENHGDEYEHGDHQNDGGKACSGQCHKRECPRGYGVEKHTGTCSGEKEVCCTKLPNKCVVLGGFCVKTKMCPKHHKHIGEVGWCGSRRFQCCAPDEPIYGCCTLKPASAKFADQVTGHIDFYQEPGKPLEYIVNLQGFSTSDAHVNHGFHVHTYGDVSDECKNAGGHFDPEGHDHSGPHANERHVGDFGNLVEDQNGNVQLKGNNSHASLSGKYNILGRSIVIKERRDDMGEGGNDGSRTHGNAGESVACCVIGYQSKKHYEKERAAVDNPLEGNGPLNTY